MFLGAIESSLFLEETCLEVFKKECHEVYNWITNLGGVLVFSFKSSWFTMLCRFLLYSRVTQSYIYLHSFSHTIFHHVLPQEIGCRSLCYPVGPHGLSILNGIVCVYSPQTPCLSRFLPLPPWQPQVCSPSLSVCFCFVDGSFVPHRLSAYDPPTRI